MYNAIISIDSESRIHIFNRAAEKLLGLRRADVLGKTYQEIFSEGPLLEIIQSGSVQTVQKVLYKDKTLVANRSPVIVEGKIVGAVSVLQDISELEKISHELKCTRELQEELLALFNASFDYLVETDARGKVIRANNAFTRITGIQAEEVIDKTIYELLEEQLFDRSATVEVIKTHKPITFTQTVRTGKTVLVTGNPIFNEQGELIRILTNGRDITELHRLKLEVEQAHGLSRHYREELKKFQMEKAEGFVVESQKMRDILHLVLQLARVDSTILISGESGVGKELIARALHNNSPRKDMPYIRVNCAAIPESLLESELFGYEAGAFTGARKEGKIGIFELAQGGTLLLDEIGELPLDLQAKLLRVIQENEINRVGGTKSIKIDIRLITATNRNLLEMVENKQFRMDLYYRLNVVPIEIPPLRERKQDIPALIKHFIRVFNMKYGFDKDFDERLIDELIDYDWPGNIRELRNVIERAIVTSPERIIREVRYPGRIAAKDKKLDLHLLPNIDLKEVVDSYEKDIIHKYVKKYRNTRKTARALGISQTSVCRKAAKYGIKFE